MDMLHKWHEWRGRVDIKLEGLETTLAEHRLEAQRDHVGIETHAKETRKAVQALQDAGIRRGEQLDALLQTSKVVRLIGTGLLLAFLAWVGAQFWLGVVRQNTTPSPAVRTQQGETTR